VRVRLAEMAILPALRRLLLVILVIGLTGTAVELLLLKHDEGPLQLVPLVSIGLALAAIGWHLVQPSRASLLALQMVMVLFLAAGVAGIFLHLRANLEYQREFDASLRGRALVWQALQAKVPPAFAPGVMLQLGLIGLAYTYGRRGELT
jgi:hypothetical protein